MRRFRRPAVTVSKRRVILFRLFLVFCAAFAVKNLTFSLF